MADGRFLEPTKYCDLRDDRVQALASWLAVDVADTADYAVRCFYWVRDEIKYTVGLYPHRASETLEKRHGSCTNKANLFVALLRARGVPSGFHVMRVDSRHYFGPICPPEVMRFMGANSAHVYSALRLDRWLKCDNTDDLDLSLGACHLNPPARPVDFDGKGDARLNIDPAHVHQDDGRCLDSVDPFLEKTPRIHPVIPAVFNAFGDFVRSEGRRIQSEWEFQEGFFPWLVRRDPALFAQFQELAGAHPPSLGDGCASVTDPPSASQGGG